MHRFYLPPERCHGVALQLDKQEAHHALDVLRLKQGESVVVLDGAGHQFTCEITESSRAGVMLAVKQKQFIPQPACSVTLLVAIPKGKIIESIVQKSVELGAARVVPLLTERVVTQLDPNDRAGKRDKWQQVAVEAIKQCGAAWLPKIETPVTIAEALQDRSGRRQTAGITGGHEACGTSAFSLQPSAFDLSLVGSLQTDRRHPRECFQEYQATHGRLPKSLAVWIGPEGDFTMDELETIVASGALPISLGRLVLRVETAAIYCLSIVNYELEAKSLV